jgi:hypothetical protein
VCGRGLLDGGTVKEGPPSDANGGCPVRPSRPKFIRTMMMNVIVTSGTRLVPGPLLLGLARRALLRAHALLRRALRGTHPAGDFWRRLRSVLPAGASVVAGTMIDCPCAAELPMADGSSRPTCACSGRRCAPPLNRQVVRCVLSVGVVGTRTQMEADDGRAELFGVRALWTT